MDESEFRAKATFALLAIEQAIERIDLDIDFENAADILTLEFADRSKIIVNLQGPTRQVWVAARSGGFHYGYDPERQLWLNDQTGAELFSELSALVSRQSGHAVTLVW